MLHILRGVPPRFDGRPISPESLIRLHQRRKHTGALFGTWTRRKPRRPAELEGGSATSSPGAGHTSGHRLVWIEPVRDFTGHRPVDPPFDGAWSLTCNPDITLVESTRGSNPAINGHRKSGHFLAVPRRELSSTSGRRSSARMSGAWCASFGVRT